MNCEYTDKVEGIINEMHWDSLVRKDWHFSFALGFKGLLNSLSNGNENCINIWRTYFGIVCQHVSVDKYQFIPNQDTLSPSVPLDIQLEIRQAGGNILPKQFADYLQSEILSIARQKLDKLCDDDKQNHKVRELADRIESLISYLHLWYEQSMTYERYFQLRGGYQSEIQQLRELVHDYVHNKNTNRREPITDIIRQIEYNEILKIYGSNILKDNPSE